MTSRWTLFLCLCMALLLPVRGTLAAVMPIGHGAALSGKVSHTQAAATDAAPCPHHETTDAAPSDTTPQQHLLCDLCNGTALAVASPFLVLNPSQPGTQVAPLTSYLSVSLPFEVKPPIV